MTRNEHRAKCIEAINAAIADYGKWPRPRQFLAPRILDSLHGIARVISVDPSEEITRNHQLIDLWHAMSAAGDLTNPPQEKL